MQNRYVSFDDYITQKLKNDPQFKKAYDDLKPWRDLQIKLIDARTKANLTQEQLAQKLGIKRAYLGRFETKLDNPTFNNLVKYARAVGLKKLVINL